MKKIHVKDNEQDFLGCEIYNPHGAVVEFHPFQKQVDLDTDKKGETIKIEEVRI